MWIVGGGILLKKTAWCKNYPGLVFKYEGSRVVNEWAFMTNTISREIIKRRY